MSRVGVVVDYLLMKRAARIALRVLMAVAAAALVAGAFVLRAGIPRPVVRRYLDRFEDAEGLRITVERVRWMPWHHLTLRGVQLVVPGTDTRVECHTVVMSIEPGLEDDRPARPVQCRFRGGRLLFERPGTAALDSIRVIEGDVLLDSSMPARIRAEATLGNDWRVRVSGSIAPSIARQPDLSRPTWGARISAFADDAHRVLGELAKQRAQGRLPETLTARVTFDADGADSSQSRAWGFIDGGPMRIGEVPLEQVSAAVAWVNGQLTVERLHAKAAHAGASVYCAGTLRPATGDVQAEVRIKAHPTLLLTAGLLPTNHMDVISLIGTLDARLDLAGNWREPAGMTIDFQASHPEAPVDSPGLTVTCADGVYSNGVLGVRRLCVTAPDLRACLPARWTVPLARARVNVCAPLHADISLEPAPVASVFSNITARISCDAVEYRGIRFKHVAAVCRRRGNDLHLAGASATLTGEGSDRTVTAQGTARLDGAYSIGLQTDAEPRRLVALLPTNIADWAAATTVNGHVHTEATLSGGSAAQTGTAVRVLIHAADVVRYGVGADLLHASLAYSNGMLQVEDLALVRPDGQVTGRIDYDVAAQLLSLDGCVTAPPIEMARFIDPGLARMLSACRMDGPLTVKGRGTVGMGPNRTRDLRLHVKGERLGWRRFLADRAEADLVVRTGKTVIENLSARWCGGDVAGSLHFDAATGSSAAGLCGMDLALTRANLASMVSAFGSIEDPAAYEGAVSGRLTLVGNAGADFLRTATGNGRVDIEDGYILSLPVFGGLSKYLSLLIPGLGYANQRALRSTFLVRDGRMETTDTQLLGKLLTVQGKGSYGFENDLEFRVQVLFLKEGLTATVTRLLTSPLTKALEFELTGTTKEPRWRPVNTPDRLLSVFTGTLDAVLPFRQSPPVDALPPPGDNPQ